jgi:hypothetical protein
MIINGPLRPPFRAVVRLQHRQLRPSRRQPRGVLDRRPQVPPPAAAVPAAPRASFGLLAVRGRATSAATVEPAREIQHRRGFSTSLIPSSQLRRLCALDEAGERTLEMAVRRMGLSARAHDRTLKVARTIADLAGAEAVAASLDAESVGQRLAAVDVEVVHDQVDGLGLRLLPGQLGG